MTYFKVPSQYLLEDLSNGTKKITLSEVILQKFAHDTFWIRSTYTLPCPVVPIKSVGTYNCPLYVVTDNATWGINKTWYQTGGAPVNRNEGRYVSIVRTVKSKTLQWDWHASSDGGTRNAYRIFGEKFIKKQLLATPLR